MGNIQTQIAINSVSEVFLLIYFYLFHSVHLNELEEFQLLKANRKAGIRTMQRISKKTRNNTESQQAK